MKLTEKKIKDLIREELESIIAEKENLNDIVDTAQKDVELEAKNIFEKFKRTAAASNGAVTTSMLKNIFIQLLQSME